jgi:hypothetical protein
LSSGNFVGRTTYVRLASFLANCKVGALPVVHSLYLSLFF